MSYILEALKKAERERRLAHVPTLETTHVPQPTTRRRVWPWVVTALLGLNAAALILLRPTPPAVTPGSRDATAVTAATAPATERAIAQPATPAPPATEARSAGQSAAARAALPEASPAGRVVASHPAPTEGKPGIDRQGIATATPPAAAAPAELHPRTPQPGSGKLTVTGDVVGPAETVSRPPPGAAAVVPREAGAPPTGPADKGRPDVRTASPAAPPPAEPKPAEQRSTIGPPAGDRPSGPGPAEAAPGSRAPETGPTLDRPDETKTPVAAAPTPGEPSPGSQRAASAKPAARAAAAAVVPREAAAPPAAPGDTPSAIQGGPPPPALRDVPATVQEAFPRLTLDVLVYSETAEDRMVFINSRKYVEGQRVEGKLVVEGITRDGAVLSYQGQRFLLRPRSNPYLRSSP